MRKRMLTNETAGVAALGDGPRTFGAELRFDF
jgi:hypothetical protein